MVVAALAAEVLVVAAEDGPDAVPFVAALLLVACKGDTKEIGIKNRVLFRFCSRLAQLCCRGDYWPFLGWRLS